MKRIKSTLGCLLVTFSLLMVINIIPAYAAEDAIPEMNINVLLREDGSAEITEIWDIQNVYEGTEYYKALNNLEDMTIHSFSVSDDTGKTYTVMEQWDTELTLEEKAHTCGILKTSKGYELCWGIGSYGNHVYTISYTIDGLVKQHGDYAGFYHQFVSERSSTTNVVNILIEMENVPLSADNARIWAYGFEGNAKIEDTGILLTQSTSALSKSDYINLLCRFDQSLFPNAATSSVTFEQLQEKAERQNSNMPIFLFIGGLLVVFLLVFGILSYVSHYHKLSDGTKVSIPSFKRLEASSMPAFDGSLFTAYAALALLRQGVSLDRLVSAHLSRWKEKMYIDIAINEVDEDETRILFLQKSIPESDAERALYRILQKHSNSQRELTVAILERMSDKISKALSDWEATAKSEGEQRLLQSNWAAENTKGKLRFTEKGFSQVIRLLGFKKYLTKLKDYRTDVTDGMALWGDYLTFSVLFGISEQVLKELEAINPVYYDTFCGAYGYNPYYMMLFYNSTDHFASTITTNTDGIDGMASSSGGGGFSGGGGSGSR